MWMHGHVYSDATHLHYSATSLRDDADRQMSGSVKRCHGDGRWMRKLVEEVRRCVSVRRVVAQRSARKTYSIRLSVERAAGLVNSGDKVAEDG